MNHLHPDFPVSDENHPFLADLEYKINQGEITGAAAGVSRLYLDRKPLSKNQRNVFAEYVVDVILPTECSRCGQSLSWDERLDAYRMEDNRCHSCEHDWNRMD